MINVLEDALNDGPRTLRGRGPFVCQHLPLLCQTWQTKNHSRLQQAIKPWIQQSGPKMHRIAGLGI